MSESGFCAAYEVYWEFFKDTQLEFERVLLVVDGLLGNGS